MKRRNNAYVATNSVYQAAGSLTRAACSSALETAYTRFYINIAPYFTLAFMEVGSCMFRLLWIYLIFPLCPELWMVYLSYPISWLLTALTHFTVSMAVRSRYMRMYPEPVDVL